MTDHSDQADSGVMFSQGDFLQLILSLTAASTYTNMAVASLMSDDQATAVEQLSTSEANVGKVLKHLREKLDARRAST